MPKSHQKMSCASLKAIQKVLAFTGMPGEWIVTENACQFRADNGAVLNYWKSTGTINFQGPELAAARLKAKVLKRAIIKR